MICGPTRIAQDKLKGKKVFPTMRCLHELFCLKNFQNQEVKMPSRRVENPTLKRGGITGESDPKNSSIHGN